MGKEKQAGRGPCLFFVMRRSGRHKRTAQRRPRRAALRNGSCGQRGPWGRAGRAKKPAPVSG